MEEYESKDHDVTNDIGTIESLSKFNHGTILVNAVMMSGCKPLLTIRFAPSSENNKMLWNKSSSPVTVKIPGIALTIARNSLHPESRLDWEPNKQGSVANGYSIEFFGSKLKSSKRYCELKKIIRVFAQIY